MSKIKAELILFAFSMATVWMVVQFFEMTR